LLGSPEKKLHHGGAECTEEEKGEVWSGAAAPHERLPEKRCLKQSRKDAKGKKRQGKAWQPWRPGVRFSSVVVQQIAAWASDLKFAVFSVFPW